MCATVCPARVPLAGEASWAGVLVARVALLGNLLLVPDGDGWVARRIAGFVGDISNRREEHACVVYPGTCVSPGHGGQPARLYPGGWFCDGCAANPNRGWNRATSRDVVTG